MRIKAGLYILVILFGVSSCGILSQKTRKGKEFDPAVAGYVGGLKPTFYYTEGVKSALLYGDAQRALKLFDKAITEDSTHSASYFEAANSLVSTDSKKALEYSLKANALDTTNLWYQTQLGRLMLLNENYDKAFAIYDKLTKELPTNPDNYRLLAALYQHNEQPFSAISVLDSAEYKIGRVEELAEFKRQLLISVKLYDKAIAESRSLIRDFPYKEENYLVLAELYGATKKDSLAMATYHEAMALNPTNPNVLSSLNQYYKNIGDNVNYLATAKQLFNNDDIKLKDKIDFFNNLIIDKSFYSNFFFQINDLASTLAIKYPNDHDVLELYASHLIASGGLEQALTLYKSHINDSVPNIKVFNNILDMEAYLNRPDSVAKYSELALSAFPSDASLYIRKGSILSYMKQNEQALVTYKEALGRTQDDSLKSVIYGIIGDLYHQQNKRGTFGYYKKALKLDPNNFSVLNNYSYFLTTDSNKESDFNLALSMAEKAVKLAPNNSTFLDTYAWALSKLQRYEEAKKVMQQAISLDRTGSSELFIHYGDILYELKEYFMASVYWKKALEKGYDAREIELRMKLIESK